MSCEQSIWTNGALATPMMRLVCSSDTSQEYLEGDTIANRFSIVNESSLALTNVSLTTNKDATVVGPFDIAAGENRVIVIDDAVDTADVAQGFANCVVTVTADHNGDVVTDQCAIQTPVGGTHEVEIVEVTFDPGSPAMNGSTTATVVIENTGNTVIDSLTVDLNPAI